MNVENIIESPYITVELVNNLKPSPDNVGVVIAEDGIESKPYGDFPRFIVEINGKRKKWTPNIESVKNMASQFGIDSRDWIGKRVAFEVGKSKKNLSMVLGRPVEILNMGGTESVSQ